MPSSPGTAPLSAIAEWTNEVKAQKIKAQAQLRAAPRHRAAPSREDVKTLITGLGDLTKAISGATLREKAAVNRALGIQGGPTTPRNDVCGSRRTSTRTWLTPHLRVGKWLVSEGGV
jgi:hypothetical protein